MSDSYIQAVEKNIDAEGERTDEITRLRSEATLLREEVSRLREALKPFARAAEYCEGLGDLDHKSVLVGNFRAAAAAIRDSRNCVPEGGKDDAP